LKNSIILSLLAVVMALTSGCASVISGSTQSMTIDSNPQGAEVSIDGAYVGITPLSLKIEKNKKETVSVRKNGYRPVSRDMTKQMDPVTILSVFWDFSTTDFITGAAMEYEPNSYFFELQKKQSN